MHKTIDKIWGREVILAITNDYVMKVLEVGKGHSISLQYHVNKEETWYVSEGQGWAQHKDKTFFLERGDSIHILPGEIHRVRAISDMKIVEASNVYLEDVVRIEGGK